MSRSHRIDQAVEQFLCRVRKMKPGGDLDALINDELGDLNRLLYEEALGEREAASASPEAGFSPSGLSALPGDAPVEEGTAGPQDPHNEGGGLL
jgi:hypothetical protein